MNNKPFWGFFEEPVNNTPPSINSQIFQGTMTRQQREEPDRACDIHLSGTMTKTATIEESDQDAQQTGYYAIPFVNNNGTQTLTTTREENDQDVQQTDYHAIPFVNSSGTKTLTETREENDQDAQSSEYSAII